MEKNFASSALRYVICHETLLFVDEWNVRSYSLLNSSRNLACSWSTFCLIWRRNIKKLENLDPKLVFIQDLQFKNSSRTSLAHLPLDLCCILPAKNLLHLYLNLHSRLRHLFGYLSIYVVFFQQRGLPTSRFMLYSSSKELASPVSEFAFQVEASVWLSNLCSSKICSLKIPLEHR